MPSYGRPQPRRRQKTRPRARPDTHAQSDARSDRRRTAIFSADDHGAATTWSGWYAAYPDREHAAERLIDEAEGLIARAGELGREIRCVESFRTGSGATAAGTLPPAGPKD